MSRLRGPDTEKLALSTRNTEGGRELRARGVKGQAVAILSFALTTPASRLYISEKRKWHGAAFDWIKFLRQWKRWTLTFWGGRRTAPPLFKSGGCVSWLEIRAGALFSTAHTEWMDHAHPLLHREGKWWLYTTLHLGYISIWAAPQQHRALEGYCVSQTNVSRLETWKVRPKRFGALKCSLVVWTE